MRITTTGFKKDYKIHGCHNRSFDNEKLLSEFDENNFHDVNSFNEPRVYIFIRGNYEHGWKRPTIVNISQINTQCTKFEQLTLFGFIDDITWKINVEEHDLVLSGLTTVYPPVVENYKNPYMNLDELVGSDSDNIFFEPIADDNLQILYIRPYILVSLDGFYGTYKYYL